MITAKAEYQSFKVPFVTSDGKKFWAVVDQSGISFFDRVSSSGTPEGNPIVKTVDDLFGWIADEGANKPFADRVSFRKGTAGR